MRKKNFLELVHNVEFLHCSALVVTEQYTAVG